MCLHYTNLRRELLLLNPVLRNWYVSKATLEISEKQVDYLKTSPLTMHKNQLQVHQKAKWKIQKLKM